MKIGAHVSAAVSLELSFEKARNIGARCTQIFVSPPQQWAQRQHGEREIERYLSAARDSGIGPNFIHGTYLINLGRTSDEHIEKSISWLIYSLKIGKLLGIQGTIFHLGSSKKDGFEAVKGSVIKGLKKILSKSPEGVQLILETSAGAGGNIGGTFQQLGELVKGVNNSRLKVCLDTCHIFAAGYDIRTQDGLDKTLKEFDKEIGLGKLVAIHANDSKFDLNSGKDRHENIGEGFIGREGFRNVVNHPKLQEIPLILEVPGFSDNGPDEENIQILKSLRRS